MKRALSTRVQGPPAGVVEVWAIPLDPPDAERERLVATLEDGERARAERMTRGGREWAVAHGALRTILAGYLDIAPATLRFSRGNAGKPRLVGVRGLEFSFARTDGLAMVAVASDRPVGIDVEHVHDREELDIDVVAREYLPAIDAAAIDAAPPEQRRDAFFQAWARHEARLKLQGKGLREQITDEAVEAGTFVVVRAVAARQGYAAAVAAEGGSWSIQVRELFATA
jgi:4'-phosphopantetheinyl transferase